MKIEPIVNQLIIFIAPAKFANLFKNSNPSIKDYKITGEEGTTWMNNNQNIVYFNYEGDNSVEAKLYDELKISESKCLLIPDKFSNFTYTPKIDFKILYHTGTDEEKLNPLRQNHFYKGELKSMEEADQIYGAIAKAIEDEKFFDKFQSFYDQIPNYNYLLEAKLNLLHQCLTPQGAKEVSTISVEDYTLIKDMELEIIDSNNKKMSVEKFIREKLTGDDPFHPDYIKALTDLRDELLKEY